MGSGALNVLVKMIDCIFLIGTEKKSKKPAIYFTGPVTLMLYSPANFTEEDLKGIKRKDVGICYKFDLLFSSNN